MNTSLLLLLAGYAAALAITTERPCEDAPIGCENHVGICKDPIDSVAYCPRFCGLCTGPTPVPVCRDYDRGCSVLANTHYCKLEIASSLCPKSCGFCSEPTTTTTPEPTTTTLGYTMIPDPACQNIDPDCITLLQVHYCGESDIVQRLCRRSCDLCPLIEVPITASPVTLSTKSGASTPQPTLPGPVVCQNNGPVCEDSRTAANCTTDELIRRLCPVTCEVCVPTNVATTPSGVTAEETTVDSGVTDGEVTDVVTDSGVTDGVTDARVTDEGVTDGVTSGGVTDGSVTDDGVTDSGVTDGMMTSSTEGPTTLKPVPSLNPFTPPSVDCRDRDPQCNFLVRSFYCSSNQLVRRICPASCDLCGPTQAPPVSPSGGPATPDSGAPTTLRVDVCEDIDPQCPTLLEFCQRTDTLVNRLCRKSCGFCGVDIIIPPPRPGLQEPLECHICVEPFCQMEIESVRKCHVDTPYCVSSIHNNQDGTRSLTRRCASQAECDEKYLGRTAADARCQAYSWDVFVRDKFNCFFCCKTNDCNIPAVPSTGTLYTAP